MNMNRRELFGCFAVTGVALGCEFTAGDIPDDLILDYGNVGHLENKWQQWRAFVDGVQIHTVFYVDIKAGFVRTYNVLGDREIYLPWRLAYRDPELVARARKGEPWEQNADGIWFKHVRGVVELRKPETL